MLLSVQFQMLCHFCMIFLLRPFGDLLILLQRLLIHFQVVFDVLLEI